MPSPTLNPGVKPVEAWAWAMYDFANSGYTTVVITAVFNAYFVAGVAGNAPWATLAWTLALAVSYALVILTAPGLGAYADLKAAKKRLLGLTTLGCVVGTAGLALVQPGDLWLAVALIVFSNFFFSTGENLIAGFLPELARGRALGRLSGMGWGLGYVGGLLILGDLPHLRQPRPGPGPGGGGLRPGDHADHCRSLPAGQPAHLPVSARAVHRAARGGRTGHHWGLPAHVGHLAACPFLPGPVPLSHLHRLLPGRGPGGHSPGGDLRRSRPWASIPSRASS